METAAIQTRGLTRRFGELTAVDNVTFSVAPGQFFGFLGPNGAGKSTTIKMLTGLIEPSAGSIEILGQPITSTSLHLKRLIGVVPEGMALAGRLTAPEYLRFVGRMYDMLAQICVLALGAGVTAAYGLWLRQLGVAVPIFLIFAFIGAVVWLQSLGSIERIVYRRCDDLLSTLVRTN